MLGLFTIFVFCQLKEDSYPWTYFMMVENFPCRALRDYPWQWSWPLPASSKWCKNWKQEILWKKIKLCWKIQKQHEPMFVLESDLNPPCSYQTIFKPTKQSGQESWCFFWWKNDSDFLNILDTKTFYICPLTQEVFGGPKHYLVPTPSSMQLQKPVQPDVLTITCIFNRTSCDRRTFQKGFDKKNITMVACTNVLNTIERIQRRTHRKYGTRKPDLAIYTTFSEPYHSREYRLKPNCTLHLLQGRAFGADGFRFSLMDFVSKYPKEKEHCPMEFSESFTAGSDI